MLKSNVDEIEFAIRIRKQKDKDIYNLYKEGVSVEDISKKYNISAKVCNFKVHKERVIRWYLNE